MSLDYKGICMDVIVNGKVAGNRILIPRDIEAGTI
jgi:hypothetical protein